MMELTDRFGRKHDYLRISLTERCNLRCFYCMPEEGIQLRPRADFLRQQEVLDLASMFVEMGVKKIRLTGGEPLVRKDVGEIMRGLGQLPVELGITTNGILVDRYWKTFKESGIQSVNVSLDSLRPARQQQITRRDHSRRIMDNIHLLLRENFRVKINAVIMKGINDDEIIDFVNWTRDLPLHLRFIEFMPFDGNRWNWDKKVSYSEMLARLQAHFSGDQIQALPGKPNDTAENYRIRGHLGTFGLISPITHPFCSTCNRIRLTADGKIKNCLFSNSESDLLTPYRAGMPLPQLKNKIRTLILAKQAQRAGIASFENEGESLYNRSMVTIGG